MIVKIPPIEKCQVLVVGDTMLDRYLYGEAERISPEAPVPVVKISHSEDKPGGAGNVALNLRALGVNVTLASICGQDEMGENLKQLLNQAGVEHYFIQCSELPTIVKQRVLSQHHQLIRLDLEKKYTKQQSGQLIEKIIPRLTQFQAIILSDYGKGTLDECALLIEAARELNLPIFIDPKGNDFAKYQGATLLTPNRKEFEAIKGPCINDTMLVEKGLAMIRELDLTALLITKGAQGMTLIQPDVPPLHLPTQAKEVFDVTGAGDTVIAALSAAIAAGSTYTEAVQFANYAAAFVVSKLGAASVTIPEIRHALHQDAPNYRGVVDESSLKIYLADAKAQGEKIVFTNGCFDLLHPGHVRYLKQAKALGERLIVAVNDDYSVKRLKGSSRPLNPLTARMEVLAALDAVDWVVSFSEDTPLRMIQALKPDVLVKGGDYTIDEIVGAKEITSWGGTVSILPYVEGFSTTSLIDKAR